MWSLKKHKVSATESLNTWASNIAYICKLWAKKCKVLILLLALTQSEKKTVSDNPEHCSK